MAKTLDAEALLKRIRAQQATPDERAAGERLLKALEAAEGEAATADDRELLQAYGLSDDPAADEPGADAEPEPVAPVLKGGLQSLPDPPAPGDVTEAIAAAGPEAEAAVDCSAVLQAQIAVYERVAKALEALSVVGLAQNELLSQVVDATNAQSGQVAGFQKSLGALQASLESGEPLQKALNKSGAELGTRLGQAIDRIGAVETVLNNRPYSQHPPRGGAGNYQKSFGAGPNGGGDVTYVQAQRLIKSATNLEDHEKAEALGSLDHYRSKGVPFAEALVAYGVSLPAN